MLLCEKPQIQQLEELELISYHLKLTIPIIPTGIDELLENKLIFSSIKSITLCLLSLDIGDICGRSVLELTKEVKEVVNENCQIKIQCQSIGLSSTLDFLSLWVDFKFGKDIVGIQDSWLYHLNKGKYYKITVKKLGLFRDWGASEQSKLILLENSHTPLEEMCISRIEGAKITEVLEEELDKSIKDYFCSRDGATTVLVNDKLQF